MATSDKFHYLPKSSAIVKESFKANDTEALRLQTYKKHLKEGLHALSNQFQKGTSVNQLLKARSALIDNILITSWRQFSINEHACLIAVGGYGRGELHPFSDIDILILLEKGVEQLEELESWLAFLWDIGLEIGHSVRTVEQCHELALTDITVATNLMESRFLCGFKRLTTQLDEIILAPTFWPSEDFYKAKVGEQRQRHLKFKDTSFNLEPNIKSNPGGLRDLQVMQWISLKHFKTTSLHHLMEIGIFTRREYRNLLQHQKFLNRVRFALHIITNKCEDRLLFDYQSTVAKWLGFEDDDSKLAVEQLMQPYYRAVMAIRNLNDLFLQIFGQEYLPQNLEYSFKDLDEDFYIQNRRIGIKDPQLFIKKPYALIKIFTHISQDDQIRQIQATTLRKIRSSQQIINNDFRRNPENIICLKEFFSIKQITSRGFSLMKRTNILGALIPLFAKIEGQMQFDLFHAYTVDEHTLFLLRHIIRYNKPECQNEFPLCSKIMGQLSDQTPILLAAIFHDIAKGRGGDHSDLGSIDALEFCKKFKLDEDISTLVSWLVQYHLIMSLTAQRKDISDPNVIEQFAKQVPSIKHLELLYVLTVSDIRATNPTLWNSWKDSLLKELFLATKHFLSQQAPTTTDSEKVQDKKQQVLELGKQSGLHEEELSACLENKDDEYYLRYHPEQIIWHCKKINPKNLPSVAIKNHRSKAGTEIVIALQDQENIFAAITAILSQNHLNIQIANLYTAPDGLCIDTFIVLNKEGQPISYAHHIDQLEKTLIHSLKDLNNRPIQVTRALPTRLKHFKVATKVSFSQDNRLGLTTLELSALDRPALLAKMGQAFIDCNIKVHAAKIVTLGEKVEDTFKVSKVDNKPITDEKDLKNLENAIIKLLDG